MVSVESLLSEVTTLFGYQLMLKAADQLFFGDKMLYCYHSNNGSKKSINDRRGREIRKEKNNEHKDKSQGDNRDARPAESDGLRNAIASARRTLKRALDDDDPAGDAVAELTKEVATLKKLSDEMRSQIEKLREDFQKMCNAQQCDEIPVPALTKQSSSSTGVDKTVKDDFDLFGSSSEEEDAEEKRVGKALRKNFAEKLILSDEKKAKKPECIAKSSIILDVKPWDDTTNMQEMEKLVRRIEKDGLLWGDAKLIPLAYGIRVLQIICVVEDEKVSVEDLIDQIIEKIPDHVQSVDIVAFNKI